MNNLIKALQILLKYGDPKYPTWCEHDTLHIKGIDQNKISKKDVKDLEELGFFIDYEEEDIYSYKYGS